MKKVLFTILVVILCCFAGTQQAQAQNAVLTADELARLGVTGAQLAQLKVVNERVSQAASALPGLVITKVLFANAGGNRFLWRIDFADKIPSDNSNIIFYINVDHNEKTGRQDYKGIDLMIWAENGVGRTSSYTPAGAVTDGPLAVSVIKENHLYVSVDIDLNQEKNETIVPMRIISQTNKPLKSQSNTPFFELHGSPISTKTKMERIKETFESENVVYTWGLADLLRFQNDADNIWIPITDAKLSGWYVQYGAYRVDSAIITSGHGSIKIKAPQDGRFYPSFILYEQDAGAAVSILVNGKKIGLAVTKDGDNNQKLFAFNKPVDLQKGDVVELRNLNNKGNFRIEGILLLKQLFPEKSNQYSYQYIAETRPWQQPDVMRITFTSTWPVQTKVLFGTTEKVDNEMEEQTTSPTNNHRIYLHDLKEGQKYFYRISGVDSDGKTVLSPLHRFIFQKPTYPTATAQTQTVPLQLSQIPQGSWPVNSGVPFPEGEVFEVTNIRLLTASNQPIAVQKKVLARWHDGSIKWVLMSFVTDAEQNKYQLQYGKKIHDTNSKFLAVRNPDGTISVDTGVLQWQAIKDQIGTYAISLSKHGKVLLGDAQIKITDANGKSYTSNFEPDEITIEENGAERAVILMRGKLGNPDKSTFFRYVVRWTFANHSPLTNVRVTLINDQVKSTFSHVESASLQFQLPASKAAVTLADLGTSQTPVRVLQNYDNQFTAQTSQGAQSGERFPGWMEWKNDDAQFSLAVRNFWQLYPKALQVKDGVLTIGIAPPMSAAEYARFEGTVEEYRSVFYLMDGNYKLRSGVSFTTEIALNLGASDGANTTDYVNHQPVLIAAPEYYRNSKVFGDIGLGGEFPLVQEYNEKTASSFDNYLKDREELHEYGLMNFGDWWGERKINWGNIEYDTMHAFILEFARSGDIRYLRAAQDAEIHNRDIDTVHYAASPPGKYYSIGGVHYAANRAMPGLAYEHSVGHTGGYFDRNPVTGKSSGTYAADGMLDAVFSSSHTWTEGHYEYYFLTGDTRSLHVANSISDIYDMYGVTNYDFTNTRTPGWLLILTMGAYNATDDPFYLNAAHIVVDRVLERQTADGGWNRQLTGGHCVHIPPHHGNAGFMVGILMTGLKNYAESTRDQRAKDAVVKAAHFMINDMWVPRSKAFHYTSCPTSSIPASLNLLIGEGIAYAWRQTHDPQLRRVMLDAMQTTISQMDGSGKNISMELRSTPPQLFDVVEMLKIQDPLSVAVQAEIPTAGQGNTVQFSAQAKTLKGTIKRYRWNFGDGATGEGNNVDHAYPNGGTYQVILTVTNSQDQVVTHNLSVHVPPPAMQKFNPQTDVIIEAEKFVAQGGGGNQIEIVEGRVNASGKAITKWETNIGHWAEWKFDIPQDGDYYITLKYASGSLQTERAITIDGKFPDPALRKVLLAGTGGYSQSTDNWQLWKLFNSERKPLQIALTKGVHTLRIANLDGGMALDFILVQK